MRHGFGIFKFLIISLAAFFVQCPESASGANILGLFTSHSPSHFIVHMSAAKALAEKGHNVTVVSSLKPTVTHPAIRHIIFPATKEQEKEINVGMKEMASKRNNLYTMMKHMFTSAHTLIAMQVDVLEDQRFTKLYNEKFDLVILGYFFNDFQLGVAAKLNCPVIVNWMSAPFELVNDFVGNPVEVSYVPAMNMGLKVGEVMGFGKRVQNFFSTSVMKVFKLFINYEMEQYYKKVFSNDKLPAYEEVKKNVSLVFCNSHFSEGPIRPNVPGLVEIGGIQIKDKPDQLPKDIAEFLDSAKQEGAILFCLGSNLKAAAIKPEKVQTIFKVLANLKQKVIWKWDDLENLPGKSANILYKKWIPQDDILAHPNLKLFITHAGKGGIAEAKYHAVPMVALPVFADQPANAEAMAASGYGRQLDLLSLTEAALKEAISEVLQNPIYKENLKKFSNLYRDRPLTARQNVIYWTEYILRHHGAPHIQSPLVHLNFIQSSNLDVIGFLLLVFYISIKIIKILSKLVYNWLRNPKKNSGYKKLKQK